MRVLIVKNYEELSVKAAEEVAELIKRKPICSWG